MSIVSYTFCGKIVRHYRNNVNDTFCGARPRLEDLLYLKVLWLVYWLICFSHYCIGSLPIFWYPVCKKYDDMQGFLYVISNGRLGTFNEFLRLLYWRLDPFHTLGFAGVVTTFIYRKACSRPRCVLLIVRVIAYPRYQPSCQPVHHAYFSIFDLLRD